MPLLRKLKTLFKKRPKYSVEELELMKRMQQDISGYSPSQKKTPDKKPKTVTEKYSGSGLTKTIDTRNLIQRAQAEKKKKAAENQRRKDLLASGMTQSQVANQLAKEKEKERLSSNKARKHYKGT